MMEDNPGIFNSTSTNPRSRCASLKYSRIVKPWIETSFTSNMFISVALFQIRFKTIQTAMRTNGGWKRLVWLEQGTFFLSEE